MCTYTQERVWTSTGRYEKPKSTTKKNGVRFPEALTVFEDDFAITVTDQESDPGELRFVSLGMGLKGRLLVVAYTYREAKIRIISVRLAEPRERTQYEAAR
jgi:uncharacterized protein